MDAPRPPASEQILDDTVAAEVRRTLGAGAYRPPVLPEVALKLTSLAARADVEISEIERTVATDAVIAARLVSIANSALYSRGSDVGSLRAAIVRIGLSEVRDVAFRVATESRVFRVPGYAERMRVLGRTAHAAGVVAQRVCKLSGIETDAGYLCGLLHDVGEVLILGIVAEGARVARTPLPPVQRLGAAVAHLHPEVGAWLVRRWKLPEAIADAIEHHEHPDASKDPSQLARVLFLTEKLLAHAGISGEWAPLTKDAEPLFAALRLDPTAAMLLLRFAESLAA